MVRPFRKRTRRAREMKHRIRRHTLEYHKLWLTLLLVVIFFAGGILLLFGVRQKQELASRLASQRQTAPNSPASFEFVDPETIAQFLSELGITLMVASIIGFTVERATRHVLHAEQHEYLTEIEEAGFKHILGFSLNPELIEEVHQTLLAARFMRQNVKIYYELDLTDSQFAESKGSSNFVSRELTVKYRSDWELHNTTKLPVQYDATFASGGLPDLPARSDRIIEYRITDSDGNLLCRHRDLKSLAQQETEEAKHENMAFDETLSSDTHLRLKKDLTIDPGDFIKVHIIIGMIRRWTDTDVFVTRYPAIGFTLHIAPVHEALHCLEFCLTTSHRLEGEEMRVHEKGSLVREWDTTVALLPYQGFEVFWYPDMKNGINAPSSNSTPPDISLPRETGT